MSFHHRPYAPLAAATALLLLAGCQQEAEQPAPEPAVTDLSGGELITEPADDSAVPVTLPETRMTPVPDSAISAAGEAADSAGQ